MRKIFKYFFTALLVIFASLAIYVLMPTPYSQNAEKMAGDVSAIFSMQKAANNSDILQQIEVASLMIV